MVLEDLVVAGHQVRGRAGHHLQLLLLLGIPVGDLGVVRNEVEGPGALRRGLGHISLEIGGTGGIKMEVIDIGGIKMEVRSLGNLRLEI